MMTEPSNTPLPNEINAPLASGWRTLFSPYVILLWALPLSVVIAGIITVVIAFRYADSTVADDYYREGLAINSRHEAEQRAALWNLSAQFMRDERGLWRVTVQNLPPGYALKPAVVQLALAHPTVAAKDRMLTIELDTQGVARLPGDWAEAAQNESWYWTLTEPEKNWRLRGFGRLSSGFALSAQDFSTKSAPVDSPPVNSTPIHSPPVKPSP